MLGADSHACFPWCCLFQQVCCSDAPPLTEPIGNLLAWSRCRWTQIVLDSQFLRNMLWGQAGAF